MSLSQPLQVPFPWLTQKVQRWRLDRKVNAIGAVSLARDPDPALASVIRRLAHHLPQEPVEELGWRVKPMGGGTHHHLYHAVHEEREYVLKVFSSRCRRQSIREFSALLLLETNQLVIGPQVIVYDEHRFGSPVIGQTYLPGRVSAAPPDTEAEWRQLLDYYGALHRVSASQTSLPLMPVLNGAARWDDFHTLVVRKIKRLPRNRTTSPVFQIEKRLRSFSPSHTRGLPGCLCHGDPNLTNFIRGETRWAAVDWEFSGWGNAAWEIAGLLAHPGMAEVGLERWQWVAAAYSELEHARVSPEAILAYARLWAAWWAARYAHALSQAPAECDDPNPRADRRAGLLGHYLGLAERLLG